MNPDFWSDKRVFLTGHTGFKGSWLSLWLQSLGAHVVGYALAPPTNPSLFEVAQVAQGMTSIIGDIRDQGLLAAAIKLHQPEIVFHMAAQPLVRYSYQNPVETYQTNVMGTVNVLEAIRNTPGVRAVVNITTDKCYENKEWVWGYREADPMGGHDPYSNSKGCSELVTSSYRNSFFQGMGIALASARAGNVIGGGDWAADRLVPDALRAFEIGQTLAVRNPYATRPWQHVLEPLCGYMALAEKLFLEGQSYAAGWNFGPNDDDVHPVSWIVADLARRWGGGAIWQVDGGEHPHEARYLKLDVSLAKSRLGWYPRMRLETSLEAIVDWHRSFLAQADMRRVSLNQIKSYASL